MDRTYIKPGNIFGFLVLLISTLNVAAQSSLAREKQVVDASNGWGGFFWMVFLAAIGLGAAYFFLFDP